MEKEQIVAVIITQRNVGEWKKKQKKLYTIQIYNEKELNALIENLHKARNVIIESRT